MSAPDIFGKTSFKIKGREVYLRELRIRLAALKLHLPELVLQTLDDIVKTEVIDTIKQKMQNDGISIKIINSTKMERKISGLTITWTIISDYKAINGFPVSVMIERGRRRFLLLPKILRSSPEERRKNPKMAKALSWVKNGQRFFSMGHEIPEYKARLYVKIVVASKRKKIQKRATKEATKYILNALTG